jgi:MinD superfamily P-loop ATPase
MRIAVASGKGGTGKTLIATSLALFVSEEETVTFLDCDVEEPDAALFLKPALHHRKEASVPVPVVDEAACTRCGRCAEVCAFNAIAVLGEHVLTFPELCHGCGACAWACPEDAIREEDRACGVVEWGRTGTIHFVHGRLTVGEAMPGPVIRAVKARAGDAANVIIDAPPGTSCPVVEAVRGCDYCILVTEPTPFGLHDLKLAIATVGKLGIPCGVIINRAGETDDLITEYLKEQQVPLLLTVPLDREIARRYARGITLAGGVPVWRDPFIRLYHTIEEAVGSRACHSQR